MQTLYLLRGLPGAGKSTLAETLRQTDPRNFKVYEADMWMKNAQGDYEFNPAKLSFAHSTCQMCARQALLEGFNVVVSNTFTTEKELDPYIGLANLFGIRVVSLIVEHRHNGVNLHGVPEEKLVQMQNRFSVKLKG